ncbi:MAG: hypothetical protein HC904_14820 [Blastochloris sp.]|nr:hypothetical protein [Blastochloris sp.]
MNTLLHHIEPLFQWIIETSWQASLLALAVLGIQFLFRGRLNPRWSHALWLLVLLRLVLPEIPTSHLSIFQIAPSTPVTWISTPPAPLPTPGPASPSLSSSSSAPFEIMDALALLWLVGVVIGLTLTLAINHRFHRHLRHRLPLRDPRLQNLLKNACAQLGLKQTPLLYEHPRIGSPAIMGLFRPALLLPPGSAERF